MSVRQYTVRDLKRIISESASEFKPVLGKDVESDNKKINDKAYKDMTKYTSKYDGGLISDGKVGIGDDENLGMQDLEYENMNDDFKKRAKAQIKGYVSVDDEKKHSKEPLGNAYRTEIEGFEEKNKELRDRKAKSKQIGLTSREIDKDKFKNLTHSVYEGCTKLKFKNTVFLAESQMLSKVPDDFKVEGKRFIMKDKNNHEYLVEWGEEPNVTDLTKINEEHDRIKELFCYKSGESKTTVKTRIEESNKVNDMLDKARRLMK